MGKTEKIRAAQWALALLILALAAGKLTYSLLVRSQLRQTAALFIGLPALVALILALTPRAKTATGMVLKGMTIAMLMSGILLEEGFICILMAAPLFYAVALAVGLTVQTLRRRADGRPSGRSLGLVLLPLLLFSLEGVFPTTTLPGYESVTVERLLASSPDRVQASLAQTPRFDRSLPAFLLLGFPRPVHAEGTGLEVGNRRAIQFASGEAPVSELVLEVVARGPNWVRFRMVSDGTVIAEWLSWHEAEVRWTEESSAHTRIRWNLSYERQLDPAWYFGPLERYAVGLAAGYLIDTLAAPR